MVVSDDEGYVRKSSSSVTVRAIRGIPDELNLTDGTILDVSHWDIISAPDSRVTRKDCGVDGSLGCNSWVVTNGDFVVKFSDFIKPRSTDRIYRSIMGGTRHHEGINDFRVIKVQYDDKLRHGVISALVPSQLMDPNYMNEVLIRHPEDAELIYVDEMISDFDKVGMENLRALGGLLSEGTKTSFKSGAAAASSASDDLHDYVALLRPQVLPEKFIDSFNAYLRTHRESDPIFVDKLIVAVSAAVKSSSKKGALSVFNNNDKLLEKWGELCARRALNRCTVDNSPGNIAVRLDRSFIDKTEEGVCGLREFMRQYWKNVDRLRLLGLGNLESIQGPERQVFAKSSFSYGSPVK